MLPLVSIGLPVFNGGAFLSQALNDLVRQSYPRTEIIVSNNASTDGSRAICEDHASRHPNIRLHNHSAKLHVMENFEFVLRQATGEYFMWAAHDDRWSPEFIAHLLPTVLADRDCGVVMSSVRRVFHDGRERDVLRFARWLSVDRSAGVIALQIAGGSPHHHYIYGIFRREVLLRLFQRFPSVAGGDRLFAMHIALATRMRYVDEVLFTKLINEQDTAKRFEAEDLGRRWRDPFWRLKLLRALPEYLLGAETIPPHRKALVPALLARMAMYYLGSPRIQRQVAGDVLRVLKRSWQPGAE